MNSKQKISFNKIGIWADFDIAKISSLADQAIGLLENLSIAYEKLHYKSFGNSNQTIKLSGYDLIVTLGGDGTLLSAAQNCARQGIPLLGINLGRIGFLTDIAPDEFEKTLTDILQGNYLEEKRDLLSARLMHNGECVAEGAALNDITVKVNTGGRMQDFATYINDQFVNHHAGDGVIVTSPTGSTAYALSCGGPIIEPSVQALAVVPICPHSLSDRPIVVKSDSQIKIKLQPRFDDEADISCDGNTIGALNADNELIIETSKLAINLLHSPEHDFYASLRSKLSYGANKSNQS